MASALRRSRSQYGIAHEALEARLDAGARPRARCAARLDASAGLYAIVAVIHHETTTGRLNDLQAL